MNRLLTKKLPAMLLAMAMMVSLVPAASAAKADFTFEVEPGENIEFSRADFKELFEEDYDEDFGYLVFTEYYDLDDYGHLEALDDDDDWVDDIDEDALDDEIWFYYAKADIENSIDCQLKDLTFVADKDADEGTLTLEFVLYGRDDEDDKVRGSIEIEIIDGSNGDVELTYEVEPDDDVTFDEDDFVDLFEEEVADTLYRMEFTGSEGLDDYGRLYVYDNDKDDDVRMEADEIEDYWFYLDPDDDNDYRIKDLYFEAYDDADGETVTLEFTLHGEDEEEVDGVLTIEIGDVEEEKDDDKKNTSDRNDVDLTFTVEEDEEVILSRSEFKKLFEKRYDNFSYLRFTDSSNLEDNGYLYSEAYDEKDDDFYEVKFDEDDITDGYFYYDKNDVEDDGDSYTLGDLTFVADDKADGEVVKLDFTLYGRKSSDKVSGTLAIEIGDVEETVTKTGSAVGDILYLSTYNTNVQLKASDFARFLQKSYPASTLQYVKINGVPSVGGLYYNYYGASSYGTTARTKLTASTCDDQNFYLSPADATQYALSELTYVPSGTNYCAPISFTAYGSGSRSVTGTVLISVSMQAVSEIYGVVPRNTSVSFPAPALVAAVAGGTSTSLASIQLLELPDRKVGAIYVGSGTGRNATTKDLYSYADSSTWQISQLRFEPASGFTGSVEIPYAACDKNGNPIAVGKFCLGVVNSIRKFSDVTSTTWCYKYITELASAGVISGYSDGTYKFNNTVTYGAALKLVMLAAGYGEQAPTVKGSTFSGYLDKARAEGIVTRSNVDLTKPITRLQVAQLAAGALDLDIDNLSSIKPFTDTADLHVQALNAAGIVEGYFVNGTSTYKPNNTVTRGQLSAIVWRMQNYTK